ncbi:hypothetical protein LPJ75_003664, partial [Coemansia sp. RSA 2598]
AAFVRILRLVAPQLLFSKEGGGRVGGAVTAQMLVALRLAALGSWAGIYCYASSRDDRRLLDVAGLHFGVLGRAWVEAIRDAAVLEINMVDVLDELENLQKMQGRGAVSRDIGAGLCLGLESTYVEIVREPLKSWYRHYLPLIVEAVSLAMRDGRLDLALEEQADFKPALLILGFALQKLASATAMDNGDDEDNRVRSSLAADLPPVCALVRRLVGSFSLETPDTVCRISAGKRQWRIGSLLETVRVLLDNSAKYRISGALVPATAGGSLWLAQAIWAHAVGRWLVAHAEPTFAAARALGVADSLLSLLARIPGNRSSSTLLVDWLFEPDHLAAHAGDSADMAGSLGLSSAGRLVLRDLLCLWNKNIGSGSANIDVLCRCLSALALVTGTVCRAGTHEKAARNLVSLWLVLWKKSLKDNIGSSSFGISDARGLSECLFRLFDSANQSGLQSAATTDTAATAAALSSGGLDDLISGDDLSAFTWVGKAASNALCEMLADCRDNGRGDGRLLLSVACVLASDSLPFISLAAQRRFVDAFVCHLACFAKSCGSSGNDNGNGNGNGSSPLDTDGHRELLSALDVFDALAGSRDTSLAVMPQLARECIPLLARLVYLHMESTVLLDRLLASLVVLATSKRYPQANGDDQGDMALAAVLMLLLSMLPDHFDTRDLGEDGIGRMRIAEAILQLATGKPASFKSVLLKLAATQPVAKKRLEAAIRSRASATVSSKKNGVDDGHGGEHIVGASRGVGDQGEIASTRISLKSSFE